AFPADDLSETLAAVIKSDPDWNALPVTTPALVRRLLRRCLEKDPSRRLRDIGDVRLDVEDAIDSLAVPPPTGTEQTSTWRQRIAVAVVLIGIGVLIGALTIWRLNAPPADRVVAAHFQVSLPAGEQLGGVDFPAVAAAPDGSALAYVGTRGGQTQLYFRRTDAVSAAPIAGTTNASAPFFSPDGRWIAFFADGRLKKVAVSGGVPIEICRAPVGVGGHWSESDSIV